MTVEVNALQHLLLPNFTKKKKKNLHLRRDLSLLIVSHTFSSTIKGKALFAL